MEWEFFTPIIALLAGLYWGLYKQHRCLGRIESKVNGISNIQEVKEELIELKDSIRMLKDG